MISANKHFLPYSTRKLLYNALIRPYFEYCVEIWGPNNLARMNVLQKKCIRHVIGTKNFIAHTNEFFIQLNTPKFPELVQSNLCRFGHKVMHMKIPESLHEDFCTLKPASSRRCFDFVPPKNNTQRLSHLPFFTISKYWNSLSSEVKQPQPLVDMKEKLKTHFINTYLALPTCKKKKCPSCLSSRPNFS